MACVLWIIWCIGLLVSMFVGTEIRKPNPKISEKQSMVLITLCIIVTGGIIVGKWAGMLLGGSFDYTIGDYMFILFFVLVGMLITYIVGSAIIGLNEFVERWQQVYFIVIFILSVIAWTIPITNYNKNIEIVKRNEVVSTTENQLVYFCNIPVQNISGEISGSSLIGTGNIRGSITTSDMIPYWYLDESGAAYYNSVIAQNSKIEFIEEDEKPYVKILSYQTQNVKLNHNNGKETIEVEAEWIQYVFYLPESIMQYNLK